ncbi:MAG: hypothetical protein IPO28_08235 [Holophagaceae bacterium]|nr:hypothetical protein [Holophagaceae bacterium]
MTGKATRFGYKESGLQPGWGWAPGGQAPSSSTAGGFAGSVNIKKASSRVPDIRPIEVETGEILFAKGDDGQGDDTSVKVAGTGAEVSMMRNWVNKVSSPLSSGSLLLDPRHGQAHEEE